MITGIALELAWMTIVFTCLPLRSDADHITWGDFAPLFRGAVNASANAPVAFAPLPGVKRVYYAPELRRLGSRFGAGEPLLTEACFEREVNRLDPERMLEAMRREAPAASIEIVDYSRVAVPAGELEFPLSGLRPGPNAAYWNGVLRYGGTHRFRIWARVKIAQRESRVVATEDCPAARPLDASKLRLEWREDLPAPGVFLTSIEDAKGRVLRRPVAAGTILRTAWLDEWKDVARGDTVRVEVWSGAARLELNGVAEASGSVGSTIPVRNPESKRRFQARVEAKGLVSVGKEKR